MSALSEVIQSGFPVCPPEDSALLLLSSVTSWAMEGARPSQFYPALPSGMGRSRGGPECLCALCLQSSEKQCSSTKTLPQLQILACGEELLVRSHC